MHPDLQLTKTFALALACFACAPFTSAQSFYKDSPLFSTAPSEVTSVNIIERLGPVGMSIELHQPAFSMAIGSIETGSPADAAGLKKGQMIESINGQSLKDIDPRIQLGQIIDTAEAKDGQLKFMLKDAATSSIKEVIVKIPVLGTYSKTWPLNCPKSEKIVRDYVAYLSKPGSNKGFSDAGMLFLVSTGGALTEAEFYAMRKEAMNKLDAEAIAAKERKERRER